MLFQLERKNISNAVYRVAFFEKKSFMDLNEALLKRNLRKKTGATNAK